MSAKCLQRKHEIQIALLRRRAATTRAVLPDPSARPEWLVTGIIHRALSPWARAPRCDRQSSQSLGSYSPLDGGNEDDDGADTGTDTAMTDDGDNDDDILSLMLQGDLECESIFRDNGVCTEVIADSIALERAIYGLCALVQPPPSASQLANRRNNARLLTDLVAVFALSLHTGGFAFQVLDVAHTWSDLGDILALTAAVHMFIQLNPPLPQQRYPRTLPELVAARSSFAYSWTVQQVSRAPSFTFWKSWG